MSNLVDHARREMELIGEDPDIIDGVCKVVQAYANMGHSGGSDSVVRPMLMELLSFHNLSPLTNDPDEWQYHDSDMWDGKNGIWQNKRNSEAFSTDGGKTFYLLGETLGQSDLHVSAPMKPRSLAE